MRRLFLDPALLTAETVQIDGSEAHHLLNVLRVRAGESLLLLDNQGHAFHAEITATEKRTVTARLLGAAETAPEPSVPITVAQALGKGDKFEQVVQHGTEAGATAFLPLQTERSIVRLNAREADSKQVRWSLIAKGAAEQSGRSRIPSVGSVTTLSDLTRRFTEYTKVLLLHAEGTSLKEALGVGRWTLGEPPSERPTSHTQYLLLVGPEGGFAPREVEQAQAAGAQVVSLGPYILRTETAALIAVSQLLFSAEWPSR